MRTTRALACVTLPVLGVSILAGGCNPPPPAPAPSQPAAQGTEVPVGTMKEIMKGIVDANSAAIWDAVGSEEGPKGTIEKAPKTDEEWTKLEYNALVLAEVANLLKTPGRKVAKPEEANSTSQPGAPELTPVQIEEKVAKDRAAWDSKVDAFQATAVKAIAAARAHNKDAILEVGSEIDSACEGCHKVYWYPDEKIPDVGSATH
jgi:hypothetical protein